MASTLKLGNGNWGVKEDSLLAYRDKNNNFKSLPFDFSRASSGTVVNKAGLIETVQSGEPRIDFKDDTKGALLLEPQSTNLVTQSELFSDASWVKSGLTVNSNQITSPSGNLTADLLIEGNSNSGHDIRYNANLPYNTYIYSVFVKKYNGGGDRNLRFLIGGVNTSGSFNLSTGLWSAATFDNPTAIDFGNGWWKLSFSDIGVAFNVITQLTNNGNVSYQGDGVSGVYIWGAQLEQNSFSTSYIPTSGSAVTRVLDTCYNDNLANVIGQTEGTFYLETVPLNSLTSYTERVIQFESSGSGFMTIQRYANDNITFYGTNCSNNWSIQGTGLFVGGQTIKIAGAYKDNDITLYVNGVQIGTNTTANAPQIEKLRFANNTSGSLGYLGSHKDVKLYNTRLSNSELAALTS